MDDNEELLGFGSDDEHCSAYLELSQQARVAQPPLGGEQRSSQRGASWERVEGAAPLGGKASREHQRMRGDDGLLLLDDEPLYGGRGGSGDEHRGEAATARLDEDDWIMSDVEEASPVPTKRENVLSTPEVATHKPTALRPVASPTPPLNAELPSRSPIPPAHPSQPPHPPVQLDPFVLLDRLPTIDEFLAAHQPVGAVSLDRTNTLPQRKDDLFDVAQVAESLPEPAAASGSSGPREEMREVQAASTSGPTGMGEDERSRSKGKGKRDGGVEQRKDKKRKLDAGHSDASARSKDRGGGSQPSASASQSAQVSTPQLSNAMPTLGDRFPSRLALLTAVSYASHSLGYTCKILRYANSFSSSIKIGCPLHLPAGPNRCPANLNASPKGENGEFEVTMCSMRHNHEGRDLGEWKPPKEKQMKKQEKRKRQRDEEQAEGEEGSSQARPSQPVSLQAEQASLEATSSTLRPPRRFDQDFSPSPAPPTLAPRRNPSPFPSRSYATTSLDLAPWTPQRHYQSPSLPLQHRRSVMPASHPRIPAFSPSLPAAPPQPNLFGLPPLPPAHSLSQPSLRDLDDPLALVFGSSTTSAPLPLFPSDSAPARSQQQARFPLPLSSPAPPLLPALDLPPLLPPSQARLPPPAAPAPSGVDAEPSQAEMDAFFGFKAPVIEPDPELDGVPVQIEEEEKDGPRFSAEEKGKGRAVVEMEGVEEEEEEEENLDGEPLVEDGGAEVQEAIVKEEEGASTSEEKEEPWQLQPIPALSPETGEPMTSEEKRLAIIDSLERLVVSILLQLINAVIPPPPPSATHGKAVKQAQWTPKPIVVKLAKRGGGAGADPSLEQETSEVKTRRLVFPRSCGGQKDSSPRLGARELAAFLKVVETIIDGLKNRTVSTKRDIFYRSVSLFVKQAVVDSIVEDIAATLRVRRGELNVVAASKGLFAGHVKITTTDGIVLEGGVQGALIPPSQMIERIEVDEVEWVLIIEKEAVFHSLCSADFLAHDQLPHGIILTGKGYPDLSTRELVKRLSVDYPSLPLLCLVDSDPHGLEILSTYKYGSSALAFDRANLAVEGVEWMGVKGSEWDLMGVRREELLALSLGDRKKALKMLKREWWPVEWRRELEYMLHIQRKAEIQILLTSSPNSNAFSQHSQSTQPSQPSQTQSTSSSSSSVGGRAPSKLVEYVVQKLMKVLNIEA